jgi:hypothetical protein
VGSDLRSLVVRSLATLAREAPAFHARLRQAMDGQRVCIASDGARFTLCFDRDDVTSTAADGTEEVFVGTDRRTLLALTDGVLSLQEALARDRLDVRAGIAGAASLFDGLQIYLRGAIRCPSMPLLLVDLRDEGSGQ